MYKIAIIGGGVVGGMIARAMSRYEKSIVIIEKENDVAMGQSKANSGIVHAGYDPVPGSLKARLNVRGSEMMEKVCQQLDVKYRRNGTLVVAFNDEDMRQLEILLQRGRENGVRGLEIVDGETVRKMEKNLSEKITGALYAPTGAVVCPYELTIHSIGNAMDNGTELMVNFCVKGLEQKDNCWKITGEDGRTVEAEFVINCAGAHSDEIAALAGDRSFEITGRRGEYFLLDKEASYLTDMTIFRTPGIMGKGVLATRTVDGNILLGPTSEDINDKDDKSTSRAGLDSVIRREYEFFDELPLDKVITQFTGVRAHGNQGDFIINSPAANFINVAGIESPGLSSAPAIAEMVEKMLLDMGISADVREDYISEYRKEPAYGRIVCRCEEVTEGEIISAIRRNPPARDIDGIKRRTRSGMGRCQGGFCMISAAEILAEESGIPFDKVTKSGPGSELVSGRTKGGDL